MITMSDAKIFSYLEKQNFKSLIDNHGVIVLNKLMCVDIINTKSLMTLTA